MKGETTTTSCRKSILDRGCRLIVLSCVSLFAFAPLIAVGDTISVQRGATLDVSVATPVTAMASGDGSLRLRLEERVGQVRSRRTVSPRAI